MRLMQRLVGTARDFGSRDDTHVLRGFSSQSAGNRVPIGFHCKRSDEVFDLLLDAQLDFERCLDQRLVSSEPVDGAEWFVHQGVLQAQARLQRLNGAPGLPRANAIQLDPDRRQLPCQPPRRNLDCTQTSGMARR